MTPCILSVDQGTSSTKAVIFDTDARVAAQASAPLDCAYPRPGFAEQDPSAIYASVIGAVRQCVSSFQKRGGDPRAIASCGISNQRETFTLWDEEGRPLCPAVSWQCERSAELCGRLRSDGQEPEVARRTGLVLAPYFSATKLLWLMENDEAVRRALTDGRARFGTMDTWLLWRLTRGRSFATDHTNASRTLLFNLDTLQWDQELLRAWGLQALVLPPCRPTVDHYGETDFDGVLPRQIPIDAMVGDSQSAAFGERCFMPGVAKATLGTGTSVVMDVGETRCPAGSGIVSTVGWSTRKTLHYALEGIIISSGATITWMRDQLGLVPTSAETESLATSVADSGGVVVVPAFGGLGSPWWKSRVRASIVGLTFASRREHVVRAGLESIAFQIADVLDAMRQQRGRDMVELRVDGGMTGNRFLLQFLADLLPVPVVNRGLIEVSALGAALLAGLGSGVFTSVSDLPSLPDAPLCFTAGEGAAMARRSYEAWQDVLKGVRSAP